MRKPHAPRTRPVECLSPARVEQLRGHLLGDGRRRDARIVSVLAYSGPRPGEAILRFRWQDLLERTLLYHPTKSGRSRSVRALGPLRQDLLEYRMSQRGSARPADLVFPRADGEAWTESDYRNWRRRIFQPAAEAAGLSIRRPYDLRHSYASLLLHEGCSVVEVAEQLGHSPQMTLSTYGHVLRELEGQERVPAEDAIRAARDTGLGHQATLGAM